MTYKACKKMIETGKRLNNLDKAAIMEKLDIFMLGERITTSEYNELVAMMEV